MKNKKGISLIVLVITIIIIIILAGAVILNLADNNPIENASEAKIMQDIDTFKSELTMYISNKYIQNVMLDVKNIQSEDKDGKRVEDIIKSMKNVKVNGVEYSDILQVYNGMLCTNKKVLDENVANGKISKYEKNIIIDALGVSSAIEIAANPNEYYGKVVTGYASETQIDEWQIFHSDGNNIYLITKEYLELFQIPNMQNGIAPGNNDGNFERGMSFSNVLSYYIGSKSIESNNPAYKEFEYVIEYPTSENANMKAVAYMVDQNIWNKFRGKNAVYAIGGPTLAQVIESYNSVNHEEGKEKIYYRLTSDVGYEVSWDDQNFGPHVIGMSTTEYNNLYSKSSDTGAEGMWLASPSYFDITHIMLLYGEGYVSNRGIGNSVDGFRPLVCLNSSVEIEEHEDGTFKIK